MNTPHGHLVISLDFELYWGVFDVRSLDNYRAHLKKVPEIVTRLLELSDLYDITLTFATVGFLFSKDKEELLEFAPKAKPAYNASKFSPYHLLETIGENESDDPYHYALSLIESIQKKTRHEIGSHTFCHYYCNETGQSPEEFEADLKAAINIANHKNSAIQSIVFPRNQINDAYLAICAKHGLLSYRGIEDHWMYNTTNTERLENPRYRICRLLDTYFNISGYNTHTPKTNKGLVNIASSRFLRPYSSKLRFLEPFKLLRIKHGMTHAAKHNEVYHLWWHPHNFGQNTDRNFKDLEVLFKHFKKLNESYDFQSKTMTGLAKLVLNRI